MHRWPDDPSFLPPSMSSFTAEVRLRTLCDHLLHGVSPSPTGGDGGGGQGKDKDKDKDKEQYADEYGEMDSSGLTHTVEAHMLESGVVLRKAPVRYNTWGRLNGARDNVLVVCHALTGNSRLDTWWGDLLGAGRPFDTDTFFVVCFNMLGSCYGTAGPLETNPETGKKYGATFPSVTIRDCVGLHLRTLREALGVTRVHCVIGGSLGGMQALEWGFIGGDLVRSVAALACGGRHHAWQIGIGKVQRRAIYADPHWNGGDYDPSRPPALGLSIARQMAMLTYRTHHSLEAKFGRKTQPQQARAHFGQSHFAVESYLNYQGDKFLKRFDANSYIALTKMMDSHDVSRGRGEYHEVLRSLKIPVLVVGVDSDVLYPLVEQQELARLLPNSTFVVVTSVEGHDGFLLEQEQVGKALTRFIVNPLAQW